MDIKFGEENTNNFDFIRKFKLYNKDENSLIKNKSQNNIFINKNLMKDFIIIEPKNSKYFQKLRNKGFKSIEEPYKKYLSEKTKIELAKKLKEIENKYIIESKLQKQLKFENDIRTKFQGFDFSKQRKRESFIDKIIKSKIFEKKEEKKKTDNISEFNNKFDIKFFLDKINFEINEKKYMFLENTNKFLPIVKYNAFKERFRIFNWNLKENPNYSTLINYISNK